MVERLIVVLFGGISIILGYRLFIVGAVEAQKGEIDLFKQIRIRALQFAPGVFFALFGVWVLTTSLNSKVQVTDTQTGRSSSFGGFSERSGANDDDIDPQEVLKGLNSLEEHGREYLETPEGTQVKEILLFEKKALLRREWSNSPSELKKYFDLLDSGQPVPQNEPTLKKIDESFRRKFG